MPKKTSSSTTTRSTRKYRTSSSSALRPRRYSIRGRGGYWDNVRSRWGQGGGKMQGAFRQAGSILGGPIGEQAGGLINRALYALTGFGDYSVRKNVLLETNGPPSVINRSNKEFVVRHREYITDIYSSTGSNNTPSPFGNLEFPINPGDSRTFPWLSSIADKFEQYRIEGMVFEYKSLYSDSVVTQNGSIGAIMLATEYNAGAPPFPNKQSMENYQFAQSCKPSHSVLHPVECDRTQNVLSELYVRPGIVPPGEDIKTYDFGTFQIASQGIPLGGAGAAVPLGELSVSYQIALIKPKIPTVSSAYVDSGFAYFSGISDNSGFAPFGPDPVPFNKIVKRSSSNLPIELVSNNTFQIPCGSVPMHYDIQAYWYGTANDSTPGAWRAPVTGLLNCITVNASNTGSYQNQILNLTASTGNGCASHYIIRVPAATPSAQVATVAFSPTNFATSAVTGARCEIYFNALPTVL